MKSCAQCGGKFGLIRHRWQSRQFCSAKCRDKFPDRLTRGTNKVRRWFKATVLYWSRLVAPVIEIGAGSASSKARSIRPPTCPSRVSAASARASARSLRS
jgi:hypothetical protein